MRCPTCNSEDLRVLETRDLDDAIRRRRECGACARRFTTFERAETLACPRCGAGETRLIGWSDAGRSLRRHWECPACGHRYTSTERLDAVTLLVVKRDGRREEFDRTKVFRGARIACEKRPVASDAIEQLADAVERDLALLGLPEVPSTTVGDLVMKHLLPLDPIAYIRFASVYREMKNLEAIRREVDLLLTQEKAAKKSGSPGLTGRPADVTGNATRL